VFFQSTWGKEWEGYSLTEKYPTIPPSYLKSNNSSFLFVEEFVLASIKATIVGRLTNSLEGNLELWVWRVKYIINH
jgi:hypothetical protein